MKPLRIAFVSTHPSIRRFRRDASFIYRCENLALALSDLGHQVKLIHLKTLLFSRRFDVVVFLRPAMGWIYNHVVEQLRKKSVILMADVDDLIFDPSYAWSRPSVLNQMANEAENKIKFKSHDDALLKLDKVIFSADALLEYYKAMHPSAQCMVIPNAGHGSWSAVQPDVSALSERSISYFSGTRTHDRDFAIVVPVLLKLLDRHSDLKVRVVGPLTTNLDHPRLVKIPRVPFEEYVKLVRTSYIVIAPLEDTPFNQCKDALKAVEAGVMGIPTVASPVGDYKKMNFDGVMLARTEKEWEKYLEFLLDKENYKKVTQGLSARINAFSNIKKHAEDFIEFTLH